VAAGLGSSVNTPFLLCCFFLGFSTGKSDNNANNTTWVKQYMIMVWWMFDD